MLGTQHSAYHLLLFFICLECYVCATEEVNKVQLFSENNEVKVNDLQKSSHGNGVV